MWNIEIDSIGGIRSGAATIDNGTNIVQASNFQGKSSFIKALQTALGATGDYNDDHPLMEGADAGSVTLDTQRQTVTTNLSRQGSGAVGPYVNQSGETILTSDHEQALARLFGCLGEDNPIRAAVRNGDDEQLTQLLRDAIDTETLNTKITKIREDIREFEGEIEDIENTRVRIKTLEQEIAQRESTVEQKQSKLEELRQKREETTGNTDDENDPQTVLERERQRRKTTEETLENRKQDKVGVKKTIDRLEAKIRELDEKIEEISVPEQTELDTEISELEDKRDSIAREVSLLNELKRVNSRILNEDGAMSLVTDVERSLDGDTVTCWTCGSETTTPDIEAGLEQIDEKITDRQQLREEISAELADLKSEQDEIKSKKNELDRLETQRGRKQATLEDKQEELQRIEEKIPELEAKANDHQAEIDRLKAEVEAQTDERDEVAEKIGELDGIIEAKQDEIDDKQEELEELREKPQEKARLEARVEKLGAVRERLLTQKDERYEAFTDRFEDQITAVIESFGTGFDHARLKTTVNADRTGDVERRTYNFELKIAREGREAPITTLSEGERELVGVILALAGYRTFNVGEFLPCVLLDGVGQLAAEHVKSVMGLLSREADIVVTTVYPEAGDFEDANVISPEEWDVISDSEASTDGDIVSA